jgi:hypothetical protein
VACALCGRRRPGVSRYMKRARPAPTDKSFIALVILLGPLAYLLRRLWTRRL